LVHKLLFLDDKPPFVVEYHVPASFDVTTVRFDGYQDLLHVFPETRGRTHQLLTFWTNEAAFNAVQSQFQADHALSNPAAANRLAKGPKSPRWRFDWGKVILVGATSLWAIQSTILGWFAGPLLAVTEDRVAKPVLVGTVIELEFKLSNDHASALCDVDIPKPTYLLEGKPATTGIDESLINELSIRNMEHGKDRVIKETCRFEKPGSYEVCINAAATAGALHRLFCGPQHVLSSRRVEVWALREVPLVERSVAVVDDQVCKVTCQLKIGNEFPNGLRVQALVDHVPGIVFKAVRFPGTLGSGEPDNSPTKDHEVAFIEWTTPSLKAFQQPFFDLLLKSNEGSIKRVSATIGHKLRFRFADASSGAR